MRVAVDKLEAQLRMAEEMVGVKLASAQRLSDWELAARLLPQWQAAYRRVESDVQQLRRDAADDASHATGPALHRVLDFLDWADRLFGVQGQALAGAARAARQEHERSAKQIDELLVGARELFALPFSTVAAPFSRLVRDLARDQAKQAQLVLQGEHVELNRRILQEIKDPLLHLLRNAVDHGVEPPALRQQRGKPAQATLTLSVLRLEDQKVRIVLEDDGQGLDADRLRAAAVAAGLVSEAEAQHLDERAVLALGFASGVSTAPAVTPVSGRGLGLAIVREKVERLGGDVQVHSRPGQGTRFTMTLPARWAAFRAVLVEAGGARLALPTAAVERVARVQPDALSRAEGRPMVTLGERVLALAGLATLLGLPGGAAGDGAGGPLVVVAHGEQRLALAVDAVFDEREVLVKPLTWPLVRVRHIAAAAVLGSGELVPLLHVADLLRRSAGAPIAPPAAAAEAGPAVPAASAPRQAATVLLAEDSITSRMLLKSILEGAGHRVITAVDGLDAWSKLRAHPVDLLVSDVEMPGLNGFDLTSRVRADRQFARLPVVLVTALRTPEDHERGLRAGASAYITKGSFDQTNLLDTIARLL